MTFYTFMLLYQDVFSPIFFMLLCALIIIYMDWKNSGGSLTLRIITVAFAWITGFLIYRLYFVVFPYGSEQWIEDMFAVAGFLASIAIVLVVWKLKKYGVETIGAILSAITVLIPYTIISPFWNISGHVTFTAAPVAYLAAIDRKWAWLFIIPILMVVNRPIVGAHTVEESVAGFLLGLLAIVGSIYVRAKRQP